MARLEGLLLAPGEGFVQGFLCCMPPAQFRPFLVFNSNLSKGPEIVQEYSPLSHPSSPPPFTHIPETFPECTTPNPLHTTFYLVHLTSYTLHTTHNTLHTTCYTLYTSNYTLYTTRYTLHTK